MFLITFFDKHLNYLLMASHAMVSSNIHLISYSIEPWTNLIPRWVGLKFTLDVPIGSRLCWSKLPIFVSWSNHQGLNMWRTSPWAPLFKISFLTLTLSITIDLKLRVEPNFTFRLVTQFPKKSNLRWSRLESWVGKPSHLRIHLEKHVTLFHVPWMFWKRALALGGQKAAALTIVTTPSTRWWSPKLLTTQTMFAFWVDPHNKLLTFLWSEEIFFYLDI